MKAGGRQGCRGARKEQPGWFQLKNTGSIRREELSTMLRASAEASVGRKPG